MEAVEAVGGLGGSATPDRDRCRRRRGEPPDQLIHHPVQESGQRRRRRPHRGEAASRLRVRQTRGIIAASLAAARYPSRTIPAPSGCNKRSAFPEGRGGTVAWQPGTRQSAWRLPKKPNLWPIITPGARTSWFTQAQSNSISAGGGRPSTVTCQGDRTGGDEEAGGSAISGLEDQGWFFWLGSQATAVWQSRLTAGGRPAASVTPPKLSLPASKGSAGGLEALPRPLRTRSIRGEAAGSHPRKAGGFQSIRHAG